MLYIASETTRVVESRKIIDFFSCINFVNNANNATLIYNSKGKGSEISVDIVIQHYFISK